MSRPPVALVIDTSEWYVDEALREHVAPRHWRRLASRAEVSAKLVLEELARRGVQATFLVSAGLAIRAPDLLLEIVSAGHEIGLVVRAPWPLHQVPESERLGMVQAWQMERAELEAVTGVGVHGFASSWAVDEGASWWHEELVTLGFDYDATAVRESSGVAVVLRGPESNVVVVGARFYAWQLDQDQPRLRGLPRRVRNEHEQPLRDGSSRLAAVCRTVSGSVAKSLGLASRSPSAPPALDKRADASNDSPSVDTTLPRLAVIVPLKDEADGIASLFYELHAVAEALCHVARCEFVIVDDGSTDNTWPLLETAARKQSKVRLVRHGENRGIAAAIQTGMHATDADWVASIDGDLSYDPMELEAMLRLHQDADVVTASPYHPDGSVHNVPSWRLFLSRTLSLAYRVLLRRNIHTWTSCFRLYRRNAVIHLPLSNQGFLGTAELLVRVIRRGGRVVEHPCVLEARLLGFSKMRVLSVIIDHMRLLVLVALGRIK